jgi:hypothetical protein
VSTLGHRRSPPASRSSPARQPGWNGRLIGQYFSPQPRLIRGGRIDSSKTSA